MDGIALLWNFTGKEGRMVQVGKDIVQKARIIFVVGFLK